MVFTQIDDAIENRLPVAVARKVIVGDEETTNTLLGVLADQKFDVVGIAKARFSTLHVDDGAEATGERTTAAGIETTA